MTNKQNQLIEKIKTIYPDDYQKIIPNLNSSNNKTFWLVNKDKKILNNLLDLGFDIQTTNIENFYKTENLPNLKLSETKEFLNGDIYIQELSSALPVLELNLKDNDKVLDLCAAPGSKSILMAKTADIQLTCVEKNKTRFFKLSENLEKYSVNANIINTDGTNLIEEFQSYFDKILVDVPCSSENKLRLDDESTFKYWNKKKWKGLVGTQKQLLNNALKMLKPNGILVYSTCTYSVEENEFILDWLIESSTNNFEILDIALKKLNLTNFKDGLVEYKDWILDNNTKKSLRVLPNSDFDAFFVFKIQKN